MCPASVISETNLKHIGHRIVAEVPANQGFLPVYGSIGPVASIKNTQPLPSNRDPLRTRSDFRQQKSTTIRANTETGPRQAAAGATFFRRFSAKFRQKIRIGLAMKIDEYVPTMIPHTSANEKPCST